MEKRLIPKKKYNWLDVLAALILLFFFAGFTVSRQTMSPWGVLFFFGFMILLVGYSIYTRWQWRYVWKKLAQKIGLVSHMGPFSKNPNNPRLTGDYRGYSIKVDRFYLLKGVMHTRIQIALASSLSNRRFRIETNNWMTRLKRKRTILNPHSLPYIELNDTVLDRSLLFQAYPAEFVREVLEPTMICQGLREVVKEVDQMGIVLFSNRLRYHETGRMYDAAYLKAVIDWLIEITQQIERVAHQKS